MSDHTTEKERSLLSPSEQTMVRSGRMDGSPVGVVAVVEHLLGERIEGNDRMHRALSQAKDRANLRQEAEIRRLREGIERLADSIHGDVGWEHNGGCEGEPDCFACIEADLRGLLLPPGKGRDSRGER